MTDRAALAAKLRWAYPRGPSHVTQEEWRIVLAALEAAPDRETLARALYDVLSDYATTSVACRDGALPLADQVLARFASRSDAEVRPRIVCLCGSTRFTVEMACLAWALERDEGYIVLGWHLLPDNHPDVQGPFTDGHAAENAGRKEHFDALHLRKIDLADDVLVLNVGGYIGESTRREIAYADAHGKPVRYLEPTRSDADAPRAPTPAPSGDDVPGEWPDSENHGEPAAPAPSEALLPCPFCGDAVILTGGGKEPVVVGCESEGCFGDRAVTWFSAHFATRAWNRRVAPQEPTDEAVVGLELDGAGGPQACVTVSENRGVYFLHAVYTTREEADAALARLSADAPSDEAVAREMSGYAPGTVGFSSCLDDVRNVRDAERAARDRAKGSG